MDDLERVEKDLANAKKELATLEAEFPKLLGSPKSQKRRDEIRQGIEDYTLALKILEKRHSVLKKQKNKIQGREQRIGVLKEQLQVYDSEPCSNAVPASLVNEFLSLAEASNCMDAARVFLQGLKREDLSKIVEASLSRFHCQKSGL